MLQERSAQNEKVNEIIVLFRVSRCHEAIQKPNNATASPTPLCHQIQTQANSAVATISLSKIVPFSDFKGGDFLCTDHYEAPVSLLGY
jgi:hypothetical protein